MSANRRSSSASYSLFSVRYGFSQSPRTPRRLNCVRWMINVFAGVSFAGFADGGGIGAGVAGLAHFLRDFELNRQPVAIPAGNVGRAFAAQGLILDDDVLENLVQRGADVDVAVGERRAVVQDEFLRARARGLNFRRKDLRGFPFFQALRLARRPGRPSWESRCAAD